mgnify:CR=1 FL=1
MKMRCFHLCLKLCLNLSWFEFGKVCQSNGLEMPCWGSIEINKCFSRTACSEICKKNIEHVGWDQEGFRTSFRANASGCVGSEHRFYYPVGEVEPGMLRTNFQHGLLILPGLQKNILFTLYIPKLNLILHNHSRLGRAGSLASKSNSDARHNFLAMLGPNSTKNQDAFFPHC